MSIEINDVLPTITYTATAGQTVFSIPFEFFADGDIVAVKNGVTLTLAPSPTDDTEYSLTGAGQTGGGALTLGGGATLADEVLIYRDMPIERTTDYPLVGPFQVEALNTDLDKTVAMMQQLERDIGRAVQVPQGEEGVDLPAASVRANRYPVFDANGDVTTSEGTGSDPALRGDLANSSTPGQGIALVYTGADYLPSAAGDGTTDDRSHFAGTARDTIYLMPGKTYYIASDLSIEAKVISLGGKMKRAANATVTFLGGFEGPKEQQLFVIDNITPTARIQIDGDGTSEYQLGTGAFLIKDKAYLRWFMESTAGDNSFALLALAETDAAEQWISTDCAFTYGVLGHSPIIDAKLTMVAATKTYTATDADPELNAFGENREFYLRPKSGLDLFHCRFTSRGEVDGNADNSFDVSDDFATMQATGANWWSKSSVNGISCTEDATAAANGWYRAPKKIVIENPYVHNTIRNGIVCNGAEDVTIINARVGNSYADHLIYADNVVKLRIEKVAVFGFARDGMLTVGGGELSQVSIHEDGLAANPITGVETSWIVNVRNDVAGHTRISFDLTGDIAPLHATNTDRVLVWSTATGKLTISGFIEPTDADDDEIFVIYGQSTTTQGVVVKDLHCQNMTLAYLVRIPDGNGDLEDFQVSNVKWRFRNGTTSSNNAMIDCNGTVNLRRARIRDFTTLSSQGVGWRYLLDCQADVEELLVDGCHFPTFNNSAQFAVIGGTASRCEVRNTRARSSRPNATLRDQIVFKESFYFGASLDSPAAGWVTHTFSGDGSTKNSGTQSHSFGDAEYYIIQPTSSDALPAGPARIVTGTNSGTLYVNTAWATGTNNVTYKVKYALSEGAL